MRAAIASLPDGRWEGEDVIDCDGLDAAVGYGVHVAIAKHGGRLEVDLSGSSAQARTALNATALDAQTAVALAVKLALDPHTPFTSGLYRDIDVVIPPGSITSARPDAAVMFYFEVQSAVRRVPQRAPRYPGPRPSQWCARPWRVPAARAAQPHSRAIRYFPKGAGSRSSNASAA